MNSMGLTDQNTSLIFWTAPKRSRRVIPFHLYVHEASRCRAHCNLQSTRVWDFYAVFVLDYVVVETGPLLFKNDPIFFSENSVSRAFFETEGCRETPNKRTIFLSSVSVWQKKLSFKIAELGKYNSSAQIKSVTCSPWRINHSGSDTNNQKALLTGRRHKSARDFLAHNASSLRLSAIQCVTAPGQRMMLSRLHFLGAEREILYVSGFLKITGFFYTQLAKFQP